MKHFKFILKNILILLFVLALANANQNAFASKTTYKVKPTYTNLNDPYTSSKVPIGTPNKPSSVANRQISTKKDDYKQYEILSDSKPLLKSWETLKAYNKINTVGTKLLEASGISENLVFSVQSSRQANASSSLHGEIVLYTGILKYVETEDELAAILGHEIGHSINRDAKITVYKSIFPEADGIISRKINRNMEYKADITSADLMVNAGYNPLAEISILNKISGHYNDRDATHPTGRKRIHALYDYIKTYYPQYISKGYPTVSYNRALKIIGE